MRNKILIIMRIYLIIKLFKQYCSALMNICYGEKYFVPFYFVNKV